MPNRIIKESICTSEEIDQLTPFQEIMFYRLIVNCDDYGRMDARAKILKSKLFPLRDARIDQIEAALEALASAELVILYEVDGKPFLQMKTWDRHQRVRAKVSKYPAPADACCQMTADSGQATAKGSEETQCAGTRSRNPIQSESKSESNPNPMRENTHAREDAEDKAFESFWEAYPRKSGDIKGAFQAWLKALADGAKPSEILDALKWQADEWRHEGEAQYIPSPEKWLTNKRWKEERRGTAKQTTTFADVYSRRREA